MKLKEIIKEVNVKEYINYDENTEILGISYNSKKITNGDIFV